MAPGPIDELLKHATALRRLARDLVGTSDADDLLQDASIAVLHSTPPARRDLLPWLRGVVRNLAGKRRRAAKVRERHEAIAGATEQSWLDAGAEAADTMRWLGEHVSALPEPYRSTIVARYLRDESPSQIAADSQTPLPTVKTRLRRGLSMLRQRCDERGEGWRPALMAAFGIQVGTTDAIGATAVAAATGAMWMSTTTKTLFTLSALAIGLLVWGPWRQPSARTPEQTAQASAAAAEIWAPDDAVQASKATGEANEAPQRTPAPPPTRASGEVAGEHVVIRVVDRSTGAPVTGYGLRQHRLAQVNVFEKTAPLHYAGDHADGQLAVAGALFEKANFVVEPTDGRYLPSRWFDANDIAERDGERTVLVELMPPVEVDVQVVVERLHTPVGCAKVELLRPWPGHDQLDLRTNAQPSERLRAQADESPAMVLFAGTRALLLGEGTTDAAGRVTLRVPPDEPLALRLLGPGHTPVVKQPWSVASGEARATRVETVAVGGVLVVRLLPTQALEQLTLERAADAEFVTEEIWARYRTGVRLHNKVTGEHRPPGGLMRGPPLPIDERGHARIDGLAPGDWEVRVCYGLEVQPPVVRQPLSTTELIEVPLPELVRLAENEVRVVDIDLTQWLPGRLEASIAPRALSLDGRVLLTPIPTDDAPTPAHISTNFRLDDQGRLSATLPPGRYFASVVQGRSVKLIPLGEFTIRPATSTHVDFSPRHVTVRVRLRAADGAAPPPGIVTLSRAGWTTFGASDDSGTAVCDSALLGDRLEVSFRPRLGAHPNGAPRYGAAIPLSALVATDAGEPVLLHLP